MSIISPQLTSKIIPRFDTQQEAEKWAGQLEAEGFTPLFTAPLNDGKWVLVGRGIVIAPQSVRPAPPAKR
jgi:hypothetical protein